MKKVLFLLSRQPLRPCASSGWVKQVRRACEWARTNQLEIISSVGMQTWEMVTALGSDANLRQTVLIPVAHEEDFENERDRIVCEFALSNDRTAFECVANADRREVLQARDRRAIGLADLLIPISVRKSGSMERRLSLAKPEKQVVTDFVCECPDKPAGLGYNPGHDTVSPVVDRLGGAWLFHWTRAVNTAWPGERLIDYYLDLANSQVYPRTAFDTLKRIAEDRKLIASTRHMPDKTPCVCFSGLTPREVVPLMRWRARYSQMSIEPYAIGIEREAAELLGVRPVSYYNGKPPGGVEEWMTQSRGRITDWKREDEYRGWGDLDLSALPNERLLLICRCAREADELERVTGIRAVGMFEGPQAR